MAFYWGLIPKLTGYLTVIVKGPTSFRTESALQFHIIFLIAISAMRIKSNVLQTVGCSLFTIMNNYSVTVYLICLVETKAMKKDK